MFRSSVYMFVSDGKIVNEKGNVSYYNLDTSPFPFSSVIRSRLTINLKHPYQQLVFRLSPFIVVKNIFMTSNIYHFFAGSSLLESTSHIHQLSNLLNFLTFPIFLRTIDNLCCMLVSISCPKVSDIFFHFQIFRQENLMILHYLSIKA